MNQSKERLELISKYAVSEFNETLNQRAIVIKTVDYIWLLDTIESLEADNSLLYNAYVNLDSKRDEQVESYSKPQRRYLEH